MIMQMKFEGSCYKRDNWNIYSNLEEHGNTLLIEDKLKFNQDFLNV